MKNLRFTGKIGEHNAYLCRIDKRKARALFELGRTVYLVPSNLAPFGGWIYPLPVKKSEQNNFEKLVSLFKNYYCINSESGYLPAYYIDLNSNETLKPIKI